MSLCSRCHRDEGKYTINDWNKSQKQDRAEFFIEFAKDIQGLSEKDLFCEDCFIHHTNTCVRAFHKYGT